MNNFWQDCLAQIKAMKLPPMIITNWFEPIELVRWDSERGDCRAARTCCSMTPCWLV